MKPLFSSLGRYESIGLLVTRLGIGLFFLFVHGWPKMMGGPERWEGLGNGIAWTGITFAPVFWGFLAMLSETLGGLLFAIGFLFRPAAILLCLTMIVASGAHLFLWDDSLAGSSHAIKMACVFFAFIFIGPGKHSVDAKL